MKLDSNVVKGMKMAKVFKDNTAAINSLDFYEDGELLVTSSDDETIRLYNACTGTMQKVIYSKKYGVDLVRFAHANNAVICASKNDWDESLRYLSLHDNSYLRYFSGHRDRVVSLAMSPSSDSFISASLDNTIRVWDLRTSSCQGLLRIKGRPAVGYDPQGLIFAVAASPGYVKLYDFRSFDRGPFASFQVSYGVPFEWGMMSFSHDGKNLALSTTEGTVFLIDAYSGQKKSVFGGIVCANAVSLKISFSADSQFITSGSEDGTLHTWSVESGAEVSAWGGHAGPVGVVQWNPKFLMLASGCTNLAFWLPEESEDMEQ